MSHEWVKSETFT